MHYQDRFNIVTLIILHLAKNYFNDAAIHLLLLRDVFGCSIKQKTSSFSVLKTVPFFSFQAYSSCDPNLITTQSRNEREYGEKWNKPKSAVSAQGLHISHLLNIPSRFCFLFYFKKEKKRPHSLQILYSWQE